TKSKAAEIRRHVMELRGRLRHYRAREWKIRLDGEDLSGSYLLWHSMNIRSVGPVLTLSPNATTNDGFFNLSPLGRRTARYCWIISVRVQRAEGESFPFPRNGLGGCDCSGRNRRCISKTKFGQ